MLRVVGPALLPALAARLQLGDQGLLRRVQGQLPHGMTARLPVRLFCHSVRPAYPGVLPRRARRPGSRRRTGRRRHGSVAGLHATGAWSAGSDADTPTRELRCICRGVLHAIQAGAPAASRSCRRARPRAAGARRSSGASRIRRWAACDLSLVARHELRCARSTRGWWCRTRRPRSASRTQVAPAAETVRAPAGTPSGCAPQVDAVASGAYCPVGATTLRLEA